MFPMGAIFFIIICFLSPSAPQQNVTTEEVVKSLPMLHIKMDMVLLFSYVSYPPKTIFDGIFGAVALAEDKVRLAAFEISYEATLIFNLTSDKTYIQEACKKFPPAPSMRTKALSNGIRSTSDILQKFGRRDARKAIFWLYDGSGLDDDDAYVVAASLQKDGIDFAICYYIPKYHSNRTLAVNAISAIPHTFQCPKDFDKSLPLQFSLLPIMWKQACGHFNESCAFDPYDGSKCVQYLWPTAAKYDRATCLNISWFQGEECPMQNCDDFCEQQWPWEDPHQACQGKCGNVSIKRLGAPKEMMKDELQYCQMSKTVACCPCPATTTSTSTTSTTTTATATATTTSPTSASKTAATTTTPEKDSCAVFSTTAIVVMVLLVAVIVGLLVGLICVVLRKRNSEKVTEKAVNPQSIVVEKGPVEATKAQNVVGTVGQSQGEERSIGVSIRDGNTTKEMAGQSQKSTGVKSTEEAAAIPNMAPMSKSATKAPTKSNLSPMPQFDKKTADNSSNKM